MSRGGRLRRVEPTTTSANGIWTLNEIADYISETKWPRGPAAPTSLSAAPGNTQLSLSWTAPATTYGTITNYLVEYTASGGSPQYVLTNSTSNSYTLTGLTNGTTYTVRVAAVTFTAGAYSSAATRTPSVETVPGAVASLSSSTDIIRNNSLDYNPIGFDWICNGGSIAWTPPTSDGGSPITGYTIAWTGGSITIGPTFRRLNYETRSNQFLQMSSAPAGSLITVRAVNAIGNGPTLSAVLQAFDCSN